jgi:hypothetical protein
LPQAPPRVLTAAATPQELGQLLAWDRPATLQGEIGKQRLRLLWQGADGARSMAQFKCAQELQLQAFARLRRRVDPEGAALERHWPAAEAARIVGATATSFPLHKFDVHQRLFAPKDPSAFFAVLALF